MICPCCGEEFTNAESFEACTGCLARSACGLVKCPHCNYESTREPGLVKRLRMAFGPKPKPRLPANTAAPPDCPVSLLLSELHPGESASIETFLDMGQMKKFIALGILPGTHVTVVKHSPSVVLRVGYSEFAFDRPLASTVKVHRLARH
jgi:Fe2+ transport system protein FeoA